MNSVYVSAKKVCLLLLLLVVFPAALSAHTDRGSVLGGLEGHVQTLAAWLPRVGQPQEERSAEDAPQLLGVLLWVTQVGAEAAIPTASLHTGEEVQRLAFHMGLMLAAVVLFLVIGIFILIYGVQSGRIRLKSSQSIDI